MAEDPINTDGGIEAVEEMGEGPNVDKDHQDMMDMEHGKMGRMRMDGKMSWEEVDEWLDLWL